MKDSAERIQYITEYIVSYKTKIESLNKCGLFDAATLYEIFAEQVCNLWFGQKFYNLNTSISNFPYVDLISEDGSIYVQVSTTQDIPSKVKKTLEKIRDNKSNKNSQISELYFFMLGNASADGAKDYFGDNKIGNIDFIVKKNLITTKEIIEKAKCDLDFQIGLYEVLYKESSSYSYNESKLDEAISISKTLMNTTIEDLINGEYEIDKSAIINEIKNDNARFISINGDAGSGKSALCKKMLRDEERLLFARAEKIAIANVLDDVWGVDIYNTLKYLNGKRIVIYIDALEFIADGLKVKIDLLQQLYEFAKKYNNVIIVTSCRTCDKTAFIKLENLYGIHSYSIDLLDENQIFKVAKHYKIIQEMWDKKAYMQLLRTPFYINLLVSKIQNANRICDIDDFRNVIWSDIICMKGRKLPSGLKISDIRNAVEKIVFKRAKDFFIGVSVEDIGEEIVSVLQSEGIVICCEGNRVRLKYDIFEDICFERLIDRQYEECKGNYADFYSEIEKFGRCIYRRYQIWVENKLFSKNNRDKFLFKLLKTNNIPDKWKCQTIVGIAKSNFCEEFFGEFENDLVKGLIYDFLRLINLYSFDTSILRLKNDNVYAQLRPIGKGRKYLIRIIYKTEQYKDETIKKQVIKICSDYSRSLIYDRDTAVPACKILEYYVQTTMENIEKSWKYQADKEINAYLMAIYKMAEFESEWIKSFWNKNKQLYIEGDRCSSRLSEDILEFVLKNTPPALAVFLPKELCELADTYWIKSQNKDKCSPFYGGMSRSKSKEYGLSKKADSYSYEFRTINDNMFINMIVQYNFFHALEWTIQLTNYAALYFRNKFPEDTFDINIWIDNVDDAKAYICYPDFWLAGVQENRVHELIGDALYLLIKSAVREINSDNSDKVAITKFAKHIKDTIIQKANNVMMLTIIEEIGRQCIKKLPGYAVELASSIELVMLDIQKTAILLPNPERELLEKQILITMGVPELNKRYEIENDSIFSLQEYIIRMQILNDEHINNKVERILDYLYSGFPDSEENAILNLQVQKMDLRKAVVSKVSDNLYALTANINGEAKKLVENSEQSKYNVEKSEFNNLIEKCNLQMSKNAFDTEQCLSIIDTMIDMMKKSEFPYQIQRTLILLVSYALSKTELDKEKRSKICCVWIKGIDSLFDNDSFVFDVILVKVLFSQINQEVDEETKTKIKYLILKCLLFRGQHGVIYDISTQAKEYLTTDKHLAKLILHTIVAISEDEMNQFIYNASQIATLDDAYKYIPNMQRPPMWVDEIFREKHIPVFNSQREQLIKEILIKEKLIDLSCWNISKCDIRTLCYISGCGLNLEDLDFYKIMNKMFPYMIEIISSGSDTHEYLDVYAIDEVTSFLKKELGYKEDVNLALGIMFDNIDFSRMNHEGYELYEDVASFMLSVYFDAYKDGTIRRRCENTIKKIENKIVSIKDGKAKKRLSKMLFLSLGKFHMRDWNDIPTKFEYADKMFLNEVWSKYGSNHFENMINIIYQLHIKELLPEVLIPLDICIDSLKTDMEEFKKKIEDTEIIVNEIITMAFLDFNDEIKMNEELTHAYEGILEALIDIDIEEAAVLLDEFRVH